MTTAYIGKHLLIPHNEISYCLRFTRRTVKALAEECAAGGKQLEDFLGLTSNSLLDILNLIEMLFLHALKADQPDMTKETTLQLLDYVSEEYTTESLMEGLIELLTEALPMVAEPAEGEEQGINPTKPKKVLKLLG